MNNRQLVFNGIRGGSGEYLMSPTSLTSFAGQVGGIGSLGSGQRGPEEGIDPCDLSSAGWGVVFAEQTPAKVREALQPLLELRRRQAAAKDERLFRELVFGQSDTARSFLDGHLVGLGRVKPKLLPYYPLVVGSPQEIPFEEQEQLDMQFAVGRLCFDTAEEYARYADSVVNAEKGESVCSRRAVLFGPQSPDDEATRMSVNDLILPVSGELADDVGGYQVETVTGQDATKTRLCELLAGGEPPAVVFTASHGICYDPDDSRLAARQGGLVCAEWPGPGKWQKALPDSFVFFGDDLPESSLLGMVTFHFACYSGGTPIQDSCTMERIAEQPFVARLPQRLLTHPKGGALAVIAHVDKSYQNSFLWYRAGVETEVFSSALRQMLQGARVGHAMDCFGQRYQEIAALLYNQSVTARRDSDEAKQLEAYLWVAYWDSRRYHILGDPAVRVQGRG